jgi:RimJ/RimL family protein N-acetyltransferase
MVRINLRPARPEDAEIVLKWRNDPSTLALSSTQRVVGWEEHLSWFKETITGNSRRLFIIQDPHEPIGQIRFDRLTDTLCNISIYLRPQSRGKEYGTEAIRSGCMEAFKIWRVDNVVACVRSKNLIARSAFLKAGFVESVSRVHCPNDHSEFVFARSSLVPNHSFDSHNRSDSE